jgi:glycosyltransferase involved in cell wall biosynthesis
LKKMNIAYATHPWAFITPGGGERQIQNYHTTINEHFKSDYKVQLFDMFNPSIHGVDLIHFFGCLPSSLDFISFLKKDCGIPLVLSPNFWPDPEGWAKSGVLPAIKAILWLADKIIVNSYIEEEALTRLMGIDHKFIGIVNNAAGEVFFKKLSPLQFREKYQIFDKFILNIANVEPRKNQLAFLRALKHYPNLKLVTIGNIRDQWYFDACVTEAPLQFIHIPQVEPHSDILVSAVNASEFFAMPSIVETPSIASLEAAACGAKILTTHLGSTREYFGDFVNYVNPYSIDSMVDGIQETLSRKASSDLQAFIQKKYTWKSVCSQLTEIYSSIKPN